MQITPSELHLPFLQMYSQAMVLLLWLGVILCGFGNAVSEDESVIYGPTVRVNQGLVSGRKELSLKGKEFHSYRAIPYAIPPVGELRFKEPLPGASWEGVLDGTKDPPQCLQINFILSNVFPDLKPTGSEDCLYLNVFTPKPNDEKANLPVMVFIHGGGFIFGSATESPPYVLMSEDIVFVVIQYRLGALGFLSTEDAVLPGNNGLKDQTLSLRWVQENIRHFGGDPDRVTIFGESAGGASVHMHMLSPSSEGLFHRIIAQSGTALCPWAFSQNHRQYADELGKAFGCSLEEGSETYVSCLQKIDGKLFVEFLDKGIQWGISPIHVLPRVDSDFLPASPGVLIKEGRYSKVNAIFGFNRDEGAVVTELMYMNPSLRNKINDDFEFYGPLAVFTGNSKRPMETARRIFQHYLNRVSFTLKPEDEAKLLKMFSDCYFIMGHDATVLLHANNADSTLYSYELNHRAEISFTNFFANNTSSWISHLDDLLYLYEGGGAFVHTLKSLEDLQMRQAIIAAWTNFARTGNPNVPELNFKWEPVTAKENSFNQLSLDQNLNMKIEMRKETRKFWHSLGLMKEMDTLLQSESLDETGDALKKEEL